MGIHMGTPSHRYLRLTDSQNQPALKTGTAWSSLGPAMYASVRLIPLTEPEIRKLV